MASPTVTRTLDLVTFTAPAGWAVEERAGGIGKHVVIHSSTPASGGLDASFAAECSSVALRTIDPVPAPTPTMSKRRG